MNHRRPGTIPSARPPRRLRPHALGLAARLALLGSIAGSGLAAAPARAQAPLPAALVRADVPAGQLGDSLNRFALQAGVSITVDAVKVEGRAAGALEGPVSVEEGFRRLLAGSGLRASRTPAGWVLADAPAAEPDRAAARPQTPAATQADTLQTVTVTANQLGDITEGSHSYTPGSIATATRLVLTPRETPQSVSVITRQKMDDFNLTSIDQVMAQTPGISIVTYDSERTEYYSRGFAVQNFQYDGIPMTRNSSYSAGNTLSDMVIYDRVEVLKGATGLLTGSGTPGATINLIRKKPTFDLRGSAKVSADSWGGARSEVDVGGALDATGSVRARGVASYQEKKTQADRYRRASDVFYGIVEADLTPDTLLTVGGDYQDNKPHASSWGGIPLLDSDGRFDERPRSFNNGANWSHWDQYTRTGFATLEHDFGNGWVAKAQYNHQINGYDANLGSAAGGHPDPSNGTGVLLWAGQYIGRTTSDALDVYASGPFGLLGRKHELVVGGSAAKRRWKNSGWYNAPGYDYHVADYDAWRGDVPAPAWAAAPDYTDDETTREQGVYTAVRWSLADKLKLITGGRVSSYRNEAEELHAKGIVVPYVGVVGDVTADTSIYASYTGIFTPQSSQDEQGHTLAPLKGKNVELGAKAALLGGRLNASAAAFQLLQDNFAIESGGLTPTGGVAYRAAQGVKTRGYELEASGEVARDWQLQAGYSHSIARQQGARVATLTPANQFTLYASHKLADTAPGLTLGGGTRWQDKTWGDVYTAAGDRRTYTVDGYWVFDATAHVDITRNVSASVTVDNLFDKKYYTIFSWYSTYTWGAGRTATASLTYKF